jgi:hypothetical protein
MVRYRLERLTHQAREVVIDVMALRTTQWLWLLLLAGLVMRVFFIWYFGDVDFEPDSYMHFLYSVSTFADLPGSLNFAVGVWQKPIFTLITGLITWVSGVHSLWIIKLFNVLIWSALGLLVYQLARQLGLSTRSALIGVFLTEFSFIGLRASIGTLTEPLFAILILAAITSLYSKRYTLSCALVSLSALTRSEGLFFLAVWVLILWIFHKRWRFSDLVVLALFPLLWNGWGYLLTGDRTFIVSSGYPVKSPYGQGGWLYYPRGFLQYDPVIFLLAVAGFGLTARRSEYRPLHLLLIVYVGFNVVAWRFGLFGTAGLLRYFVAIVPWLAIYSAAVFEYSNVFLAYQYLAKRGLSLFLLQVIFTTLIIVSGTSAYNAHNTPTVHHNLIEAGQWVKDNHPDKYLYASHPALLYYASRDFYSSAIALDSNPLWKDSIVAFDWDFGSTSLLHYLEPFPLLKEYEDYLYIYDYDLDSIEAQPTLSFSSEAIQPYLQGGWSKIEEWGTWSVGSSSELGLYFRNPESATITMSVLPYFTPGRRQSIDIYYNNVLVGNYEFPKGDASVQSFSVSVPRSLVSGKRDVVKFEYGYTVSPSELGVGRDGRQLAVGFLEMRVAVGK